MYIFKNILRAGVSAVVYLVPGLLYTGFLFYYGSIENDAFENSSSGDFVRVAIGAALLFWAMIWVSNKPGGTWLSLLIISSMGLNLCFSFTNWYYYDSPFGSIAALTVLDGNQQASSEFLRAHWLVVVFFIAAVGVTQFIVQRIASRAARKGNARKGRTSAIVAVCWFSLGVFADFVINPAYDNTGVFKHANLADFFSKTPFYNASHLLYAYDSKEFVV